MNSRIQVHLDQLVSHKIYQNITSLPELRLFMQNHVFAVWDFMTLLKRLQRDLTRIELPWIPPKDINAARLINEIVLCEESDLGYDRKPASHLDMYLDAMDEIGAERETFISFLGNIHSENVGQCLFDMGMPGHVSDFVTGNIELAMNGEVEEVAANFLYGREDSIPIMFSKLLGSVGVGEEAAPKFYYYLQRHIEVDGGEHGPAAAKILEDLVAADPAKKERAEKAAIDAIQARIKLWDGILVDILSLR